MQIAPRPHSLTLANAGPDPEPIKGLESNAVSAAKTLINVWRFLPADVQATYETDGLVCAFETLDAADEDDWDEHEE